MTHQHGKHEHPSRPRTSGDGTVERIWLAATWPFFRDQLPLPPARVVELGCGPYGGQVPALLTAGYDAVGVDPQAPDGSEYMQLPIEEFHPDRPLDAVIASVSLHHVDDLGEVLDHVANMVRPGGSVVVVEWFSEQFDEATAQWCFRHLNRDPGQSSHWLANVHEEWQESNLSWDTYFSGRLQQHGIHPGSMVLRDLTARFTTIHKSSGPYYFPSLAHADANAEQAAIDAGEIRAGCLRYRGDRSR